MGWGSVIGWSLFGGLLADYGPEFVTFDFLVPLFVPLPLGLVGDGVGVPFGVVVFACGPVGGVADGLLVEVDGGEGAFVFIDHDDGVGFDSLSNEVVKGSGEDFGSHEWGGHLAEDGLHLAHGLEAEDLADLVEGLSDEVGLGLHCLCLSSEIGV